MVRMKEVICRKAAMHGKTWFFILTILKSYYFSLFLLELVLSCSIFGCYCN